MIYKAWIAVVFAAITVLTVNAQNPDIIIKPTGDYFTRPLNTSFLFTCEAVRMNSPETNAELKWFNNEGTEIRDTTGRLYIERDGNQILKLYFTRIENRDAGIYKCTGRVEGNIVEKQTELLIFKDIHFDHAPTPQHPAIDTNALIECRVSGQPAPIVTWRYRGERIQTGGRYVVQLDGLRIKDITEEDNGEYTCRAEVPSDGRYDQKQIDVIVHIPPTITQPPAADAQGTEGHEATIECKATGKPDPKYEFYKDGSDAPLGSNERREVDRDAGKINFRPVIKDDEGDYKCRALNDVGMAEGSGALFVIVPPKIEELRNVSGLEGKSKTLECITQGDPAPAMKFRKVGNPYDYEDGENENGRVIVRNTSPGTLEMTVDPLEPTDSSNYTCKADNEGGEDARNGTVVVEFSPRFDPDHERLVYNWAGKTRNLTCHALGEPEPFLQWFRHDQLLVNNETFRIYEMGRTSALQVTIRDVDEGWIYGPYACRAKNNHGSRDLEIIMERADVPDEPKEVNVKDSSPTMVILTVVPPDEDGGVEIHGYRVEYESKKQDFALDEEILIENLRPMTMYIFRVRAKNEVGVGHPKEMTHTTDAIREPYPIILISDPYGKYPYEYTLNWEKPRTGGLPIKEYEFKFRRVEVKDGTFIPEKPLEDWSRRLKEDDPERPMLHYRIEGLKHNQYYQVEVSAYNDIGWSSPNAEFVFLTATDPNYQEIPPSPTMGKAEPHEEDDAAASTAGGGLGTGAVIGIVIALFFIFIIIVDISCYYMNHCGMLAIICGRMGQGGAKGGERAMEEGESDKKPLDEPQICADEPEQLKPDHSEGEENKEALKEELDAEEAEEKIPLTEEQPKAEPVMMMEEEPQEADPSDVEIKQKKLDSENQIPVEQPASA